MKKLITQKAFNIKKDNLLVESCGSRISSCGGGVSAPTTDELRRSRIKKRRNDLIDELEHTCDECFTELSKNAKFCQECGTKVPEGLVWE
jgi:hypothetical protein